jgi:hypothetical protein
MCEAVLQQWVLLAQQLLPDSCSSSSSSQATPGGQAAGTIAAPAEGLAPAGTNAGDTGQQACTSGASPSAAGAAANAAAGSAAEADSLETLLPELNTTLSSILLACEKSIGSNSSTASSSSSSSSSSSTTPAPDVITHSNSSTNPTTAAASTTSSSSQRLSLALQVTAAAESCVRALAATEHSKTMYARVVGRLQRLLLPSNCSEAEHHQQLREAQLPLLCSIIKAMTLNRSVGWGFLGSPQELRASTMITSAAGDNVAVALQELAAFSSSSSSSSAGDERLAGSLSVLMLLARWLRVRALQLQYACDRVPAEGNLMDSALQGVEPRTAERLRATNFTSTGRNVQAAAEVVAAAAGCAAGHLSTMIKSCLDDHQAVSSSSSSNSSVPEHALQQLLQQLLDLRSSAAFVRVVMWCARQANSS